MPNSTQIVYLSKTQYAELIANQSITVNGVTVNYNENDIYVTPQSEPITDVKINGISIENNKVANIPLAGVSVAGVVKVAAKNGVQMNSNGEIYITTANTTHIKNGQPVTTSALTPYHAAGTAFYGLANAAGDTTQHDTNYGNYTYTDGAKAAIQNMLGVTDLISTEESSPATVAHALNSTFMMNGKLHRATAAIAVGDAVTEGENCEVVKADEVFVKNTDIAGPNNVGVVKTDITKGIGAEATGRLYIYDASIGGIKAGDGAYASITPRRQHYSVFYGLSKVAGVDLANEEVTFGTYPETSKTAIRNMLGAVSSDVIAVQDEQPTAADTKVWLPETEQQGIEVPTYTEFQTLDNSVVKKTDYASSSNFGIVKVNSGNGIYVSPSDNCLSINPATDAQYKAGTANYRVATPAGMYMGTFYGLAKAAGDTTQSISTNAVGTYTSEAKAAIQSMLDVPSKADVANLIAVSTTAPSESEAKIWIDTDDSTTVQVPTVSEMNLALATKVGDVQVNGTSVVSNGVANIPLANSSQPGVIKVGYGLTTSWSGILYTSPATANDIKQGTVGYVPIVPQTQHSAAFYGLAKAAGDTTQSASSNAVGTYTTEAKAAIHTMLGIDPASIAAQVDIPLVETVEGTTPSIIGQPNVRYVCGEVSTITLTPPASGSMDVIFESGSTAAVLTVPNTVKWPAWFDATALETDTTYEILITDGVYGSVMTWAN